MPPKRKEHGRDDRAEKAAKLYLFCARDPDQSLLSARSSVPIKSGSDRKRRLR